MGKVWQEKSSRVVWSALINLPKGGYKEVHVEIFTVIPGIVNNIGFGVARTAE